MNYSNCYIVMEFLEFTDSHEHHLYFCYLNLLGALHGYHSSFESTGGGGFWFLACKPGTGLTGTRHSTASIEMMTAVERLKSNLTEEAKKTVTGREARDKSGSQTGFQSLATVSLNKKLQTDAEQDLLLLNQ